MTGRRYHDEPGILFWKIAPVRGRYVRAVAGGSFPARSLHDRLPRSGRAAPRETTGAFYGFAAAGCGNLVIAVQPCGVPASHESGNQRSACCNKDPRRCGENERIARDCLARWARANSIPKCVSPCTFANSNSLLECKNPFAV